MMKTNRLLTAVSLGVFLLSAGSSLAAEQAIVGKVTISSSLKDKVAPTAALYIIARPEGATSGPPVAVKRIAAPFQFPVNFEITAADLMLPGGAFEGEFSVNARIAQSGSATPVNAGDLQTSKPVNHVHANGKSITLKIDSLKK